MRVIIGWFFLLVVASSAQAQTLQLKDTVSGKSLELSEGDVVFYHQWKKSYTQHGVVREVRSDSVRIHGRWFALNELHFLAKKSGKMVVAYNGFLAAKLIGGGLALSGINSFVTFMVYGGYVNEYIHRAWIGAAMTVAGGLVLLTSNSLGTMTCDHLSLDVSKSTHQLLTSGTQ